MQFVFIVCQVEDYRNILKLSCRPLAFTSYYTLLKNKKRSGTSLFCLIFCIIFIEKYFSFHILLIDQVSLSGCFYFLRYWAICVLQLFVNQIVTSWILKLIWHFLYMTKNHDKNLNILRKKWAFKIK